MAWANGGRTRTTTTAGRHFRRQVLRRDGYQCVQCGHHDPTGRTIQADHITNVASGGVEHDPGNGQTLCNTCHNTKTQREASAGRAAKSRRRPKERHPGLM
ncbi:MULTISPECIES: HNH endonuclease [unclassified Rhodococcus (in: high G+C Gram-positive bacteria)]|uniref:HNH endonuclease n=1 Tax=unclassified Rhodococcus (in: high G+C Gram-positive bacteria) TaxID=192944 RepID=UPI000933CDD6|nr:hypothetical protein BKE56_015635 [Rhodococcus sp. M8]